jgi:hypothetical protein
MARVHRTIPTNSVQVEKLVLLDFMRSSRVLAA